MNFTNSTTEEDQDQKQVWQLIYGVIFNSITLYLSTNQAFLFAFRYRGKKWPAKLDNKFWMNLSLVICGFEITALALLDNIKYFVVFPTRSVISISFTFISSYISLYSVLWFRQRIFYTVPGVDELTSPAIRLFSRIEGFIFLIGGCGMLGIDAYYIFIKECTILTCNSQQNFMPVIFLFYNLQTQISMLILFVFPLIKHMQRSDQGSRRHLNRILGTVKRAAILTAINIISDTGSAFLVVFATKKYIMKLLITNSFFNYLLILFIFNKWSERLLPLWLCERRRVTDQTEELGKT